MDTSPVSSSSDLLSPSYSTDPSPRLVPDISYSSSEDEDFFDAEDDGCVNILTLVVLSYGIELFTHFKLWLAAATHNFKRVKIADICTIWMNT